MSQNGPMSATSHSRTPGRLPDMRPFEDVVRAHGATVLRVCRAMLDEHDADDAWSETFLAALRAYDGARIANVEAWLVTIAKRKCLDVLRARARHAIPVAELPVRESDLGIPDDERGMLWDAIADLPPRQRLSVAYHHLLGLPHAEVAAVIGGTPTAVRRAAADGVLALRVRFEREASAS